MTNVQTELKYLFVARYTDGSLFEQKPEDISHRDSTRSAFYDVLQDEKEGKELESFFLVGGDHTYAVDLRDGHFEIDGTSLWVGDQLPPENVKLRLIYYRQKTHQFTLGQDGFVLDENGKPLQANFQCRYCIGWQATSEGKNHQEVIGVY